MVDPEEALSSCLQTSPSSSHCSHLKSELTEYLSFLLFVTLPFKSVKYYSFKRMHIYIHIYILYIYQSLVSAYQGAQNLVGGKWKCVTGSASDGKIDANVDCPHGSRYHNITETALKYCHLMRNVAVCRQGWHRRLIERSCMFKSRLP